MDARFEKLKVSHALLHGPLLVNITLLSPTSSYNGLRRCKMELDDPALGIYTVSKRL
jgi:hypothetical protein